ncbi:MAG: NAD(P)H-binding protein [Pseudomonadota bacterium]
MSKQVLILGATGTIGRATVAALIDAGHSVRALVRPGARLLDGDAHLRCLTGDVTKPGDLDRAMAGVDTVMSCLASRTGQPADAWAIDHDAHRGILDAAQRHGVGHMILLSAICVQKPQLAFQQAKLSFEQALIASGTGYTIVRATAYLKSLAGQLDRIRAGKPYLMFGDGTGTACKPISDADLGRFLARTVTDPSMTNQILPIGGPGPALTPRAMAEEMFAQLAMPPRFRQVPVLLLDTLIGGLSLAGRFNQRAVAAADMARIGRYYATESMLVWDGDAARYAPDATPEFGTQTWADMLADLIAGRVSAERGDHAVF